MQTQTNHLGNKKNAAAYEYGILESKLLAQTHKKLRREENQLYVTECFIALMIRSTCFGHFYAHHQELETIFVLLPPMVCSAWLLVVGGQEQDSRLCVQEEGCCTSCNIPIPGSIACCLAPDPRQPANMLCTP